MHKTMVKKKVLHVYYVLHVKFKKLSIIDDEKTKEITTVHAALVLHVIENHVNLHA